MLSCIEIFQWETTDAKQPLLYNKGVMSAELANCSGAQARLLATSMPTEKLT